jgi:hypothetical protein
MSQNQRLSARQEETAKIPSFKITGDFKSLVSAYSTTAAKHTYIISCYKGNVNREIKKNEENHILNRVNKIFLNVVMNY